MFLSAKGLSVSTIRPLPAVFPLREFKPGVTTCELRLPPENEQHGEQGDGGKYQHCKYDVHMGWISSVRHVKIKVFLPYCDSGKWSKPVLQFFNGGRWPPGRNTACPSRIRTGPSEKS
jgi:hypothetical protein